MSSVTKKCKKCGVMVDPKHTGACPNGHTDGYAITASIVEHIQIGETISTTVRRERRRQQIKKKPIKFVLGLVSFAVSIALTQWQHDLSFVLTVIHAALGFAAMPINEIVHIIEKETEIH